MAKTIEKKAANKNGVQHMKKDFEHIFTECRNVTEEYTSGRSALRSIGQLFLRLFAELL